MDFIRPDELLPIYGPVIIGRFLEAKMTTPKEGTNKQPSRYYEVQVPFYGGNIATLGLFFPRDGSFKEVPLTPGTFYSFPITMRGSATGIFYTLAGPVADAPG